MKSTPVLIQTEVTEKDGAVTIKSSAEFMLGSEVVKAESVREFSATSNVYSSLSKEEAIGVFKRDTLRELVTHLNLHGVL